MDKTMELIEHERFDGFFDVAVTQLTAGRKVGVHYKRTAYDALKERGLIDDAVARKATIYSLLDRRCDLPARERTLLERLTITAGAKLLAWINTTVANEVTD